MALQFHYFPLKARNALPLVIAAAGGIAIETPPTAWPDFKPNTLFGQLPHLRVDGLEISQSMAIARVLARRAKLDGASEADFAMSEMLLEQFTDIIGSLANAKSAADQDASWGALPAKFTNLFGAISKILGDKPSFTSTLTAGELAVAVAISLATDAIPSSIDAFPNLISFFAKHKALVDKTMEGYSKYYVPK